MGTAVSKKTAGYNQHTCVLEPTKYKETLIHKGRKSPLKESVL